MVRGTLRAAFISSRGPVPVVRNEDVAVGGGIVTRQMLRRRCSTYMAQITTVKDVQAHLRHTNAKTTPEHDHQIGARECTRCRRVVGSVVEEEAGRFRNAHELNHLNPTR